MGEIFSRPHPVRSLPFTGERLTSELGGQTEIEHLHRYMLAREFCRGKRVLDVASGEGYGTAMLAQVAESAVGVEIAADAVTHAAASYDAPNLRFVHGDARRIPLEDASVDVVVSFETIEHFEGQEDFLAGVRRVLRSGGVLIVSTPDRDTYSPADQPPNPYHRHELTREEFAQLLGRHFANVALCWQRTLTGSALLPGPGVAMTDAMCFERRGDTHFEGSSGFPRPQYLVALCSDAALPPVPASIYIDHGQLHSREQEWLAKVNAERARYQALEANIARDRTVFAATDEKLRVTTERAELSEASLRVAESRAAAAEARAEAADARATAAESRIAAAETAARAAALTEAQLANIQASLGALKEGDRRQQEIDLLRGQLASVVNSSSWRLTAPLRGLRSAFSRRSA